MTEHNAVDQVVEPTSDRVILLVVCAYAAAFVVFGLFVDGLDQVLRGLAPDRHDPRRAAYRLFRHRRHRRRVRERRPADAVRVLGLLPREGEDHRRFGRGPVPGAWIRTVRQESAQHLVDRHSASFSTRDSRASRLRHISTRHSSARRSRRCSRKSCSAPTLAARGSRAARSVHEPRHRIHPCRRPPRNSSRRTWASACTTWASPPAS